MKVLSPWRDLCEDGGITEPGPVGSRDLGIIDATGNQGVATVARIASLAEGKTWIQPF
jgi:hypothetical protein